MGKYKHFIKNVSILAVAQFSSKFLSFLLVPIYTAYLETEEYGTFDLIYSLIKLMVPILSLNMTEGALRILMDRENEEKERKSVSYALMYIFAGTAIVGAFLLAEHFLFPIKYLKGYEIHSFLLYFVFVVNKAMMSFARGMTRVADLGISGFVSAVTMVGLNIFFLAIMKAGINGFFIATILGLSAQAIYLFLRLEIWKWITIPNDIELEKEMREYSVPVVFSSIGWWVNNSSDKFITSAICGVSANGLLSTAYKIPLIVSTVESVYDDAWLISAVKEYEKKSYKRFYEKMYASFVILMSGICLFILVFIRQITKIMFSGSFIVAWVYVPILLVASMTSAMAGFMGPILVAKKNTKAMGQSAIVSATINVVLNIILALRFGVQGIAIATMISGYVMYFMRYYAAKEDIGLKYFHRGNLTILLLLFDAIVVLMVEQSVIGLFTVGLSVVIFFLLWRKECMNVIKSLVSNGAEKLD